VTVNTSHCLPCNFFCLFAFISSSLFISLMGFPVQPNLSPLSFYGVCVCVCVCVWCTSCHVCYGLFVSLLLCPHPPHAQWLLTAMGRHPPVYLPSVSNLLAYRCYLFSLFLDLLGRRLRVLWGGSRQLQSACVSSVEGRRGKRDHVGVWVCVLLVLRCWCC